MNPDLEERLRNEYRELTTDEARKAVSDASQIDSYNAVPLAIALLQLRVRHYHYWKQRRIAELEKSGELDKYMNGGKND